MDQAVQKKIRRLEIRGLNESYDVEIPIKDNRIVLVGVNGLGKSTTINALYFALSKQWHRLVELNIKSIKIRMEKEVIELDVEEVKEAVTWREDFAFPPAYSRAIDRLRDSGQLDNFLAASDGELRRFEPLLRMPMSNIPRFRAGVRTALTSAPGLKNVTNAAKKIDELIGQSQILYLPTYRRIEKDLRTVIPDLEDYIRRFHDQSLRMAGRRTESYIELVEFGMEDVEAKIADTLKFLKEGSRQLFNGLAGSYLKDVIKGEGQTYDQDEIMGLTDEDISGILNRVEENTLNENEKIMLRASIERLKGKADDRLNDDDSYVAHIFSKLVVTARALTEREKPVTRFVEVCNRYLEGKRFVYDEQKYELQVRDPKSKTIELRDLSSGEKQIVSLFSQLYLSGDRQYIIIIDEPELSLSVPWQETFLPDIVASGHCDFLAAVTHSPFIFENTMDPFVRDMKDCVKSR